MENLIEPIAYTLLHSIWLGALILFIYWTSSKLISSARAALRYNIASLLLLGFLIGVVLTFSFYLKTLDNGIAAEKKLELSLLFISDQVNSSSKSTIQWLQQNLNGIVIAWSVGVVIMFLRLTGSILYLRFLIIKSQKVQVENWLNACKRLQNRLHLNGNIEMRISKYVDVPCVIGVLKPIILFPVAYTTNLSFEQVEIILSHELSHIKRHDFLINVLQSVVEILFFFNPFIWALSAIMRTEREHATDDMAVSILNDKTNYIKTLAAIEEVRFQPALANNFATNNNLITRIKRLTGMKTQNLKDVKIIVLLVTAAMIMSFGWFSSNNSEMEGMVMESNAFFDDEEEDQNEVEPALNDKTQFTSSQLEGEPNEEDEIIEVNPYEVIDKSDTVGKNKSKDKSKSKQKDKSKSDKAVKSKKAEKAQKAEKAEKTESEGAFYFSEPEEDWARWSEEFEEKFTEQMKDFEFLSDTEKEVMMADFKRMVAEMEHIKEIEQMELAREQRHMVEEQRHLADEQKRMIIEQKHLAEEQKRLAMEAIRDIKISEIEIQEDLKKELEKLEENMKLHEKEMRHLEEEMRIMEENMKEFDKQLTKELIKDGYFKNGESINSIDVSNSGVMKINGEKIKEEDAKRYFQLMDDILGESHGNFKYRK